MYPLAPIVLFAFNRPEHTRMCLESLKRNPLASESELFIFIDAPKKEASEIVKQKNAEVKKAIREQQWCGKVHITEFETNRTLPNSLTEKLPEILAIYGKIIVLEDDLLLSEGFLKYMNEALEMYKDDPKVMDVTGFMFPVKKKIKSAFFLKGQVGWGWGTWKRSWDLFNPSADELLEQVEKKGIYAFNWDGGYNYYAMLKECAVGTWKFWDIRWFASIYVNDGLCYCPPVSLVRNIGHDGSGLHSYEDTLYQTMKIAKEVKVERIPLEENLFARKAISNHLRKIYNPDEKISFSRRIKEKLNLIIKKYF